MVSSIMTVSEILIYLTPVMTGLIGWFTNWVAVKMLFKPKEPVNIGFMRIQGIFPKRQSKLAERIGKMVALELLTTHDIRNKIMEEGNLEAMKLFIEEKIDEYLERTFPSKYPIASVFFGRARRNQIKIDILEEVERIAPDVIERIIEEIEQKFDVEAIITDKVTQLSPEKLEGLIQGILKKEFRFIELSGAVLGFLVGVIQVLFIEIFK
ncbi:MAG: DUF445 family protein [Flavobacteriales bacterium]|nr:DUF445 family protein [Flavobacteriales bacterium]